MYRRDSDKFTNYPYREFNDSGQCEGQWSVGNDIKMSWNRAGKGVHRALLRYTWNKQTNKQGNKKSNYLCLLETSRFNSQNIKIGLENSE